MKILIAAIGKAKAGSAEQQLYHDYAKRLPWKIECRECAVKAADGRRKAREGAWLLDACRGYGRIVALDEGGKTLSSREFAQTLESWRQQGESSVAFVIGGSDGLSDDVLQAAHLRWSLGRVTWPHMLVRALLAEQLYRAHTMLSGHPYHRD